VLAVWRECHRPARIRVPRETTFEQEGDAAGVREVRRLGIECVPSAGEPTRSVGIFGVLLGRFGGVILTVMWSETGCVDGAASPTSFLRTQGISL